MNLEVIQAQGINIKIYDKGLDNTYISLTDIASYKNKDEPNDVIRNWLRRLNTIEFIGLWEILHNPDFNPVEFDGVKREAGHNSFTVKANKYSSRFLSEGSN